MLGASQVQGQSFQTLLQVNSFLNDALWYSERFVTPATDGAVYQASSGWVETPQKKKLWDVSVSVHTNAFFVPKSNRTFRVNQSDLSFFQFEDGRQSADLPTALGGDEQLYLVGYLGEGENAQGVRIKTPEGIDMASIVYPYLQASLGLWYGTEITGKYTYKVQLKNGYYQVWGAGIKHNISQYFSKLEKQDFYLSIFAGYSNEEISFGFLNGSTEQYGALGINEITGLVDTYQFQINGSKRWGNFEAMAALITNVSDIKYEVGGENGTPQLILPVKQYVNDRLKDIYTTRTNVLGEVSGRYQFAKRFYVQAAFAFGKYANLNASVQCEL